MKESRMKRTVNFLGWTTLASLALCIVLVAAVWATAGAMDPMTVQIDGDTFSLDHLGAGESLLAIGGLALAALVVLLVVPLAVLIPLAVVVVALVGLLLVLAGMLALVFSPLIFVVGVVWLMVRLIRRDKGRPAPVAGATIRG